ncbi:MAG: hypothetical protein WCA55_19010 [Xanthobacteraceae bacterium]
MKLRALAAFETAKFNRALASQPLIATLAASLGQFDALGGSSVRVLLVLLVPDLSHRCSVLPFRQRVPVPALGQYTLPRRGA